MSSDAQRPVGERLDMPFTGIASFLRAPICTDLQSLEADIAVLGVPSDEGSPFMPGSRFGPRAIREHSLRFVNGEFGYYDPQRRRRFLAKETAERRLVDVGDVDILPTNVAGTFENVTRTVQAILDRGALVAVLGGDHAVTYPVVRGIAQQCHVLHFDAHLDYMPFVHGLEYTNQHAFRQIRRLPTIESLTQIGIRSIRNTEEMLEDSLRDGNRVVTMQEFRASPYDVIANAVPEGATCYVSIDIDVLDMALVPGCVSAEPDGMTYAELRDALRAVARRSRVIGFDLVEVNPLLDLRTGVTAYLGTHTVVEFLGAIRDVAANSV
ncbi:MAG TPA: arginase family protein [Candidatus Saccharimonadales bacterium]|nr:arginase family protein [Candidatus Saccharimonadales bacterium]